MASPSARPPCLPKMLSSPSRALARLAFPTRPPNLLKSLSSPARAPSLPPPPSSPFSRVRLLSVFLSRCFLFLFPRSLFSHSISRPFSISVSPALFLALDPAHTLTPCHNRSLARSRARLLVPSLCPSAPFAPHLFVLSSVCLCFFLVLLLCSLTVAVALSHSRFRFRWLLR